ncbi:Crp/Fnr family transcriptional regulator [Sediminicola luteus]|uniref:Cyclic nucleotide-binding domain-containing protein n=1 Tax=Sediminicola luteus TaxID=319238 RepID=A0A2A4G624_9FLAO|nr:Crp/Fnr family transcriptional regulator [Sediminicola luteus]PCE64419.1 hypothetical protein B7P33_09015 [Sediminicola luteus]
MNGILEALDRYYPLSDSSKKLLANQLQPLSLAKGQTLMHEDEVSEHIYFIEKGALRTFFFDDKGNQTVVWFGFEGDICFSLTAYFNLDYNYTIRTVLYEDCQLYTMPMDHFLKLYETHLDWANWGRRFAETHLLYNYTEVDSYRPLNATERYLDFMERNPEIVKRVPQKDIASYLGVSPVTLSRIRGKKWP